MDIEDNGIITGAERELYEPRKKDRVFPSTLCSACNARFYFTKDQVGSKQQEKRECDKCFKQNVQALPQAEEKR